MAQRGPRRKAHKSKETLALRIRDGVAEAEPGKVAAVPPAPDYLCAYGREMFNRLAPKLVRLQLLTEIDDVLLVMYCDAWATWRRTREALNKLNAKSKAQDRRALMTALNRTRLEVMRLGVDLGLSPGARTRIDIGKARVADEAESEFFS
jgi:P27 family predicted phage terminase small subunit